MKYIKKFNELKSNTYERAAKKLRQIGHGNRAKKMEDHIEHVKEIERSKEFDLSMEKWKKNVEEYSKYGTFKFSIKADTSENSRYKSYTNIIESNEFYISIGFISDMFEDSIHRIDPKPGYTEHVTMWIGLIPTSEEQIHRVIGTLKSNKLSPDFYNGFFFSNWIGFKIEFEEDTIKVVNFGIDPYDEGQNGEPNPSDRRTAGKLKNLLVDILSNKIEYKNGDSDNTIFQDMEDLVCNKSGFSGDYGLSMSQFSDYMKKVNPNSLFKETEITP
jgi:hypothetical protein